MIIAVSGRSLAQSAVKSTRNVVVLDAFADADTRQLATTHAVGLDRSIGLHTGRMLSALERVTAGRRADIVTGSGFERVPSRLHRVARFGRLCANAADRVRALKDPLLGLELLAATGWDVPETQLAPPGAAEGWLQKRTGGAGGIHVRPAAGTRHRRRCYYQRIAPGDAHSVTFLADGERAHVLGFNRLAFSTVGSLPFCHAGADSGVMLPASVAASIGHRLDRLVCVLALRGLNGLDFLWDGERAVAIEINPRPTATAELYDDDFPEGLVHWHRRSFDGALQFPDRASSWRALRIVYADRPLIVPVDATFPPGCRDRPVAGSTIAAGAPILSVFATGSDTADLRQQLGAGIAAVHATIATWNTESPSPDV